MYIGYTHIYTRIKESHSRYLIGARSRSCPLSARSRCVFLAAHAVQREHGERSRGLQVARAEMGVSIESEWTECRVYRGFKGEEGFKDQFRSISLIIMINGELSKDKR